MKRFTALLGLVGFLLGSFLHAADDPRDNSKKNNENRGAPQPRTAQPGRQPARARMSRPAPVRQPVIIHMNGSNNNGGYQPGKQPSYGKTQWNRTVQPRQPSRPIAAQKAPSVQQPRQQPNRADAPAVRSAA